MSNIIKLKQSFGQINAHKNLKFHTNKIITINNKFLFLITYFKRRKFRGKKVSRIRTFYIFRGITKKRFYSYQIIATEANAGTQ